MGAAVGMAVGLLIVIILLPICCTGICVALIVYCVCCKKNDTTVVVTGQPQAAPMGMGAPPPQQGGYQPGYQAPATSYQPMKQDMML